MSRMRNERPVAKFQGHFLEITVEMSDKKCHFLCERLSNFLFVYQKIWILDMSSCLYIQFLTRNPNLQSELTNSFTQRRKLRKTNLRESRFLIVRFLIIRLHRTVRLFIHGRHARIDGQIVDQLFGQIFGQSFGQIGGQVLFQKQPYTTDIYL